MTQNDNGFKSFLFSGATTTLGAFSCVDVTTVGAITAASFLSRPIGILQEDAVAGNFASVKMLSASGTFMIAVSGSICTAGTNYSLVTNGGIGGVVATATLFKALTTTTVGAIGEFAYIGGAGPIA